MSEKSNNIIAEEKNQLLKILVELLGVKISKNVQKF